MVRSLCIVPLLFLATACGGESGMTGDSDTATSATATSSMTATASTTQGPGTDATSAGQTSNMTDSTGGPTSDPTTSDTSDPSTSNTSGPTTGDPTTGNPTTGDPTTGSTSDTGGDPPPLGDDACQGYATRYWDCCKAHCGWPGNVHPETNPADSCNSDNVSHGGDYNVPSSCNALEPSSAYTCFDESPWAVSDTLAYGFAAVPAQGDICGRCYQLDFAGTGHYNDNDPGSVALTGKKMIVQATNIGHDVGGGQFDILTPGGGVGLFDACSYQWNVETSELGATYGGFMTHCQQQLGNDDHQALKACVQARCDAVFDEPHMADLAAGCAWYVNWYEVADNPNLRYQEVPCPPALVAISGIDRGPLNDVEACMGGGGSCSQEEMDNCDCSWTNGGQNCGQDDGSCCWTACCG